MKVLKAGKAPKVPNKDGKISRSIEISNIRDSTRSNRIIKSHKMSECGEMMEINESTKIKESTKSTKVEALKSGK